MNKISELRERYSLSRKQMSELTGVPVRTLQSWELGDRVAPDYMYNLIENTLKATVQVKSGQPFLVSSVQDVSSMELNEVLKKEFYSLTPKDKNLIISAYIAQMNAEHVKKDRGGIYGFTQRHMAYNSNKMEGNQLTEDDTATLFETNQLPQGEYRPKDIEEMTGHFLMFNKMMSTLNAPLTQELIKSFHYELEAGVFEFRANGYVPGEYKSRVNTVSNLTTSRPENVAADMERMLRDYEGWAHSYMNGPMSLALLHSSYELIHPFQDGNGRTGRMLLFRECLVNNHIPIIVEDANKDAYRKALNLSQTQREHDQLVRFFIQSQESFYHVLQEFMYDHSIKLGNDMDNEEENER